jgi:hypothetical protein
MAFVEAVVWGEHELVWDLLSPTGRLTVLQVAAEAGLDAAVAARLREGTAATAERGRFLIELVRGLRVDLHEVDPDRVRYVVAGSPLAEQGRGEGPGTMGGLALDEHAPDNEHGSGRGVDGSPPTREADELGSFETWVRLEMPTAEGLGGHLPLGELQLSCHGGSWAIDALRLLSWGPAPP